MVTPRFTPPQPGSPQPRFPEDEPFAASGNYKGHGSPNGRFPAAIGATYLDLDTQDTWRKIAYPIRKTGWVKEGGEGSVEADSFGSDDGDDALLARAVAAMAVSGNLGTLRLSARTYTLTEPWVVGPNESQYSGLMELRIIGHGAGGVDGGTRILQTADSDAIQCNDCRIVLEHVLIQNSFTGNTGSGIKITDSAHGVIQHCSFMRCGGGAIRFAGSANHTWQINNNWTQNCAWGVIAGSGTQLISSTIGPRNEFTSTEAVGARTGVGIEVTHAIALHICGNTVEVLKDGIIVNGSDGGDCVGITINDENYFEDIDRYAIYAMATDQAIGNLTIDGNFFNIEDSDWGIYCGASSIFGLDVRNNTLVPYFATFMNFANVTAFRRACNILVSHQDQIADIVLPSTAIIMPRITSGGVVGSAATLTMTGHLAIIGTDTPDDYFLDPNGANRNVTTSNSTFIKHQPVRITNRASATWVITFDPTGFNFPIYPGETATFYFLGGVLGWSISKPASILNGASVAFRGVGAFTVAAPATFASTLVATSTITSNNAVDVTTVGRLTFGVVNAVMSFVARALSTFNLVFQYAGSVGATMDAIGAWAIGAGVPTAPTTRIFEIQGTNRFSRPWPSGTKAQRDAITAGDGDSWYQTDNTPGLRVFENGAWVRYTATADP